MVHCRHCGGSVKLIAAIGTPAVIVRVVTHPGLHARAPPETARVLKALAQGYVANRMGGYPQKRRLSVPLSSLRNISRTSVASHGPSLYVQQALSYATASQRYFNRTERFFGYITVGAACANVKLAQQIRLGRPLGKAYGSWLNPRVCHGAGQPWEGASTNWIV
jgi:hypothetical protein